MTFDRFIAIMTSVSQRPSCFHAGNARLIPFHSLFIIISYVQVVHAAIARCLVSKLHSVANFHDGSVKFSPITLDMMGNGRAKFGNDHVIIVGVAAVQSQPTIGQTSAPLPNRRAPSSNRRSVANIHDRRPKFSAITLDIPEIACANFGEHRTIRAGVASVQSRPNKKPKTKQTPNPNWYRAAHQSLTKSPCPIMNDRF